MAKCNLVNIERKHILSVWCGGTGKPQIAANISSEANKISFLFNESKFL